MKQRMSTLLCLGLILSFQETRAALPNPAKTNAQELQIAPLKMRSEFRKALLPSIEVKNMLGYQQKLRLICTPNGIMAIRNVLSELVYLIKTDDDGIHLKKIEDMVKELEPLVFHSKLRSNPEQHMAAKSLVNHAVDVNKADKCGFTPLYRAALNGELSFVEYFVTKGAEIDKANTYGITPFGVASSGGHLFVVDFLRRHGADINRPDDVGHTPLFNASYNGHLLTVDYLVRHRADIENANPLHMAASRGHFPVVKYLVSHGANVNAVDNDGRNALCEVLFTAWVHKLNEKNLAMVQYLLDHGADVNQSARYGITPFHLVVEYGTLEEVNLLLRYGADVNKETEGYYSSKLKPMHKALQRRSFPIMQCLVEHGAIVPDGALRNALNREQLEIAKYLIEHGANVNETSSFSGTTPLGIAKDKGYTEIEKLLRERGAIDPREGAPTLSLVIAPGAQNSQRSGSSSSSQSTRRPQGSLSPWGSFFDKE